VELEEERRLAYVGMTRAVKELFLINSRMRSLYGRTNMYHVSRLIHEIPEDLLEGAEHVQPSMLGSPNVKSAGKKRRAAKINRTGAKKESWHPGDKADHKKWGTGTVVNVQGEGDSLELDIAFPAPIGIKRVLAKFA